MGRLRPVVSFHAAARRGAMAHSESAVLSSSPRKASSAALSLDFRRHLGASVQQPPSLLKQSAIGLSHNQGLKLRRVGYWLGFA
jgi:hypothetical protein